TLSCTGRMTSLPSVVSSPHICVHLSTCAITSHDGATGKMSAMAMRRVVPILLVAILTSGAAASDGDPILEQYRAEAIDGLLKPALQKAEALAKEGRVSESNQAVLDAVPEERRRPVHNFALGNILYRTRPELSRDLHRKAMEAVPESAMAQLEYAM